VALAKPQFFVSSRYFFKLTAWVITYEAEVTKQVTAFKRPFNTVFPDYAHFPNMNVHQNVSSGLKMKRVEKKAIQQ